MEMYFPKLILNGIQCFKGDKATQGELGTPGRLGNKAWLLPKASWVRLSPGRLGVA